MSLDLSYNNISMIEVGTLHPAAVMGTIVKWYLFQVTFFEPVENDLKVLNLSSNIIEEVSLDDVGQLRRLRCIDISRSD